MQEHWPLWQACEYRPIPPGGYLLNWKGLGLVYTPLTSRRSFPLPLWAASVAGCTSAGQKLWNVYWWERGKGWQQPHESFVMESTNTAFIPPFRLGDSSNSSNSIFPQFWWILCIWLSQTLLQRSLFDIENSGLEYHKDHAGLVLSFSTGTASLFYTFTGIQMR